MRTMDRHDQLLRLLRRRADWTVADLARELGVSRRTVLRDLGALRGAGFDIDTFSGPGGGVRLNPTSVMITSQLRTNEVIALIVSVELARAAKTVPFAAGAQHALAKIEQALPAARVAHLRALRERILVGEPSGDAIPGDIDPNLVEAFETAFTNTRLLAFTYRDRHGRHTKRRVEPHGLLVRQPLWYVIAWDTDKNAPRLFRADRVSTPILTAASDSSRPPPSLSEATGMRATPVHVHSYLPVHVDPYADKWPRSVDNCPVSVELARCRAVTWRATTSMRRRREEVSSRVARRRRMRLDVSLNVASVDGLRAGQGWRCAKRTAPGTFWSRLSSMWALTVNPASRSRVATWSGWRRWT